MKNESKTKTFIKEEKKAFRDFGTQTYDEVETLTGDVFKQIGSQVTVLASITLGFIRKNPAIAVAAAVTISLIIAKMMKKPSIDSMPATH